MSDRQRIHQLERRLTACAGTLPADIYEKIDIMNELAWALSDIDLKRAETLCKTVYALAESPATGLPPYQRGLGYSLRTLGYLNQRLGNYPLGLAQLLKAQEICESLQLDDGLADVFDGIAGIYYQISNFPEMLNYSYRQLEAAQKMGDSRRIANAYNNLANVYFETGDYERAIDTLTQNLQLAADIDYKRIEVLSYLNLAETYILAGDNEKALQNAQQGLAVTQTADFELFEVYAFDLIGKSYLKLDKPAQAIHHLEQALALSRKIESKVTESLILLNLGEAYREIQQCELALDYLQRGVATAQSINANSELFKDHLLLSEIYEQSGDFAQALYHYKQHQAFKELVFGEKADERLNVLQVAHDTATARAEARFLLQQTDELQREVSERIRAEAQVQRQLNYTRALSACSQILLRASESDTDNRCLLVEALHHLIEPAQSNKIFIYENFNHPELGFCSRFMLDVSAPGIPTAQDNPRVAVIPWSVVSAENQRMLAAGEPVGGPVKTLFSGTPAFRDYLLNQVKVLYVQVFPIHFGDTWWGYVGFDDRTAERAWSEEEILLMSTVAEMLSSTLQRWQAQKQLKTINERLEEQVKIRTVELSDTIDLLQREIQQREQAEAEVLHTLASLEQRVVARTEELSTFFDLTLLAGQSADLDDVFRQALPRILEVTRSRAICIHFFDEQRATLSLMAQQDLPNLALVQLQTVELSPDFQQWLQQPADPLVTVNLSACPLLPAKFYLTEFKAYVGAQIRSGAQVEGLLSCYRFTQRGFGLDEVSLVVALAEQLGMVLETRRLRQTARDVAVLEERQRLARDLHDSVTQSIYSLTLFARSAREAAEEDGAGQIVSTLTDIEEIALHTLQEMRLLLYELRAPYLEQEGLAQALATRLNLVERRFGLDVIYEVDPAGLELPQPIEQEFYRLAIEGLNNIFKHAAASRIKVSLCALNGQAGLTLSDDGRGFELCRATGGLGLKGMQERVERLGGTLEIVTAPGDGTKIIVKVDLTNE